MIVFNKPHFSKNSHEFLKDVATSGQHSGGGKYTKLCENFIEQKYDVKKAILTSSCTDALEMCAILLDIGPGDEIIVPSYSFVTCANAFAIFGAKIVFVDVDPHTLNIDINSVTNAITEKTKAVLAVNYGGQSANLVALKKTCEAHSLLLIEDAAQSIEARYKGKYLGTFGDLATISFHETKNISCGEGGALIINNKNYIEQAIRVRDKGTNRDEFFKNLVNKYTWISKGSSYLMSEFTAAILYAQLLEIEEITASRINVWDAYFKFFRDLKHPDINMLGVDPSCAHNGHLFAIFLDNGKDREDFRLRLCSNDLMSVSHYEPLHLSIAGKRFGRAHGTLDISKDKSATLLRLPIWSHQFPIDNAMEALSKTFGSE